MDNNFIVIFLGKSDFSEYLLAVREDLGGPDGPPLMRTFMIYFMSSGTFLTINLLTVFSVDLFLSTPLCPRSRG